MEGPTPLSWLSYLLKGKKTIYLIRKGLTMLVLLYMQSRVKTIRLILSQLESGLSSFTIVRRTHSLLRAFWRVRLAVLELDGLFSCTKGCSNGWSRHGPPKVKLDKNNSNYFVGKSECMCARTLFVLFGGFI